MYGDGGICKCFGFRQRAVGATYVSPLPLAPNHSILLGAQLIA